MGGPHRHHPGVENDWPGEQLLSGEQRGGAVNTDGVLSLKAAAVTIRVVAGHWSGWGVGGWGEEGERKSLG